MLVLTFQKRYQTKKIVHINFNLISSSIIPVLRIRTFIGHN